MTTTAQTTASIAPIAAQYQLNAHLALQAIDDIKPEHLSARHNDSVNSFHWILGHLARSRFGIANLIGLDVEQPFGDFFAGKGDGSTDGAPGIDEIKAKFDELNEKFSAHLAKMTEEELSREIESEFPMQEKTVHGALAFMSLHESVHVGQLMLLRKIFGYSALVG